MSLSIYSRKIIFLKWDITMHLSIFLKKLILYYGNKQDVKCLGNIARNVHLKSHATLQINVATQESSWIAKTESKECRKEALRSKSITDSSWCWSLSILTNTFSHILNIKLIIENSFFTPKFPPVALHILPFYHSPLLSTIKFSNSIVLQNVIEIKFYSR